LLNLLENRMIQSIKQIKGNIKESFSAAIPICLGYLPLGFACGVLAQKAGLSIVKETVLLTIKYDLTLLSSIFETFDY